LNIAAWQYFLWGPREDDAPSNESTIVAVKFTIFSQMEMGSSLAFFVALFWAKLRGKK